MLHTEGALLLGMEPGSATLPFRPLLERGVGDFARMRAVILDAVRPDSMALTLRVCQSPATFDAMARHVPNGGWWRGPDLLATRLRELRLTRLLACAAASLRSVPPRATRAR